jgi:hypothetical protein
MMTDTVVDRTAIEQAADQTSVELVEEFGEIGHVALKGNLKAYVEFMMLIAQHDPALGVNMNDAMVLHMLGTPSSDLNLWLFPGFFLEGDPEGGVEDLDPEGYDPFRGSDIDSR